MGTCIINVQRLECKLVEPKWVRNGNAPEMGLDIVYSDMKVSGVHKRTGLY